MGVLNSFLRHLLRCLIQTNIWKKTCHYWWNWSIVHTRSSRNSNFTCNSLVQKEDYTWHNMKKFARIRMKMLRIISNKWESFMANISRENLLHQVRKCFYLIFTYIYSQINYGINGLVHLLLIFFST